MEPSNQAPAAKKPRAVDSLKGKRRAFVFEYLVDRNGTQAAIRAKFSRKTAGSIASEYLKIPSIRLAIDEETERMNDETSMKAHEVCKELSRLGSVDATALYDENGNFKKIHELPEDVRRAISSIEMEHVPVTKRVKVVERGREVERDEITFVARIKKIQFWNKNEALGLLARHRKMLTDKTELTGKDGSPLAPPMLDLTGVDLELLKRIAEGGV